VSKLSDDNNVTIHCYN